MVELIKEAVEGVTMDMAKYIYFFPKFGCAGIERTMEGGFHLFMVS